jgi:hypothetical protein
MNNLNEKLLTNIGGIINKHLYIKNVNDPSLALSITNDIVNFLKENNIISDADENKSVIELLNEIKKDN